MPPDPSPLERLLPSRDPNFLAAPAQDPQQPAPPQQRVTPFQPQQQNPPTQPQQAVDDGPQDDPVTREDFDLLLSLIAANVQPAAPAAAPVAPAAPPAPTFSLGVPQIQPTQIDPEEFARVTESPEALARYVQSVVQGSAVRLTEHFQAAVPVAAAAAVRAEMERNTAYEQWFERNPDIADLPPDVTRTAIEEVRKTFPTAPTAAILTMAGRKLRSAIRQSTDMSRPGANPSTLPARSNAPSATRQMRGGPNVQPKLSPATQAFVEMADSHANQNPLIDGNGRLR